MLYRLVNPKKQSAWQDEYERIYDEQFNHKIVNIGKDEIANLTAKDALWIMHYEDQLLPEVIECPAFVFAQANGTASNPYCYQVDEKKEIEAIDRSLDAVLVYNDEMLQSMKEWCPEGCYYTVGFPVEVPSKYKGAKKEKKIVVAGRISPDKQFYLATYLLYGLHKDYRIVFALTEGQEKWLDMYHPERFPWIEFKCLSHDDFLAELSTASHYFSCSLGDTGSVSLTEALLLDCYPVIPRFDTLQPVYDKYVSVGYTAFNKAEVQKLVLERPDFTWEYTYSDPEQCAIRLKTLLAKCMVQY